MLAAADLVDVWERGIDASPGERGLLLLGVAEPQVDPRALAEWSVGRRDAALMKLRAQAFGGRLEGLASCPRCEASLELEVPLADIADADSRADAATTLTVAHEELSVTFGLPSAGDLAALGRGDAAGDPERWLLDRCVVSVHRGGEPATADVLPEVVVAAIGEAMRDAEPQAEVELSLTCPECGHEWDATFDIVTFLWREIDARAPNVLREVGTLAARFGWSEQAILALSPRRRQLYLELATEAG